jgi:hypothetical protein
LKYRWQDEAEFGKFRVDQYQMNTIYLGAGFLFLLATAGCKKSNVASPAAGPNPATIVDSTPLAELPLSEVDHRSAKAARPAPKIGTLDEGFKMPWTKISVALAADDGCTGLHLQHELVISRKNSEMTIRGKERISNEQVVETPERSLCRAEFDDIVKKLGEFHKVADSEIDLGEYFSSFPPEERLRRMEAYEQEHGSRYGGFGGIYFYVQFDTDKPDTVVKNAFNVSKSSQDYLDWIRGWRKSCWATIGI